MHFYLTQVEKVENGLSVRISNLNSQNILLSHHSALHLSRNETDQL